MEGCEKLDSLLELFLNYAIGRDNSYSSEDKRTLMTRLRNNNWKNLTRLETRIKHILKPISPILIESKGDVKFKNPRNGDTILHRFFTNCIEETHLCNNNGESCRDWRVVDYLIKEGASVIVLNNKNNAPLGIAASKKRFDLVRMILNKGKNIDDINETTDIFMLIAQIAAQNCQLEILETLKRKKLDLNFQSNEGDNLLISLCKNINELTDDSSILKTMDWLLSHGCDVNWKNKQGFTALHYAAQTKMLVVVNALLEAGANINAKALNNTNPLFCAAVAGSLEVMQYLMERSKDTKCEDNKYGFNLLHVVSYNLNKRKFDLIIDRGFDVNSPAKDGETPLHLASLQRNAKVVEKLIQLGAKVDSLCQPWKYTPLHLVSIAGQFEYTKPGLVEKLKLIQSSNNFRESLLKKINYRATTELLLRARANIDAKDKFGWTPLHFSIKSTNDEVAIQLLQAGAAIDIQNADGLLTLHYALKYRRTFIWFCSLLTERLIEFGADINEIEWPKRGYFHEILCRDTNMANLLIRHAIKLKAAGLAIDKVYELYIEAFKEKTYYSQCLKEIKEMKNYLVEKGLSLYNLLHLSSKRRYKFEGRLPSDIKERFEIYYYLIQASIRQACDRQKLMDSANFALKQITNFNWPYLCSVHILSYLSNRYLRVLIESAQIL